ncbi:MAG: hypothetical protein ABIR70_19745 [Bryobacteraceae bacterium]
MKRLNRLLMLGFLGLFGALAASGQALINMRIGLNEEAAKFVVDGQSYLYRATFVWPEGSTHVVEFPMSAIGGDPQPYQYHPSGNARYDFKGWSYVAPATFQLPTGPAVYITVNRNLTELNGVVEKQFPIDFEFPNGNGNPLLQGCSPVVDVDQIDRHGVMLVTGRTIFPPGSTSPCVPKNLTVWAVAGTFAFQAFAYPGYTPTVVVQGQNYFKPEYFTVPLQDATVVQTYFEPAKRVRFSTSPSGLKVLVDRTTVTPQVMDYLAPRLVDYCTDVALNVKTPLGIKPLCTGDYDFARGSTHLIGAEPVQTDPNGDFWIFDRFSNGMGQNSVYVTPSDIYNREDIQALFIHGVRSSIDSNVPGLKISIDGSDAAPNPYYGFIWAEGSTHRLKPPAFQRDTKGRMWKFVGWSDGGEAEHDITVPVGGKDFRVTATFEVLGQVQITTTPPGLTINVDGAECTTPCSFDKEAGAALSVTAAKNVPLGESSRYDFQTWAGRTDALVQTTTFDKNVQVLTAQYHGSHRFLAYSDPEDGAKFKFSPESADGFYPEGANVQVTVVPNTGFKFIIWGEDLQSKTATESLAIAGPSVAVAHMEKVPQIAPAGIRNAAGDTPDGTVAPGSIISIYGAGLTEELQIGPSNPLAQAIGDVYVTVNDSLLPLIFVSPTQINAQLLSSLGEGDYTLKVHNATGKDITGTFKVKRNAPGVFYNVTESGMPLIAALHQDGSPITQDSPAQKGETISFYGTGLGAYDRPIIDGFLLPSTDIYKLTDPVKVVAGVPTSGALADTNAAAVQPALRDPSFAGGAPGMVGTSLVKVTIDKDLPTGNVLEISILVNGSQSNKVQLPVQ